MTTEPKPNDHEVIDFEYAWDKAFAGYIANAALPESIASWSGDMTIHDLTAAARDYANSEWQNYLVTALPPPPQPDRCKDCGEPVVPESDATLTFNGIRESFQPTGRPVHVPDLHGVFYHACGFSRDMLDTPVDTPEEVTDMP